MRKKDFSHCQQIPEFSQDHLYDVIGSKNELTVGDNQRNNINANDEKEFVEILNIETFTN